MLSHSWCTYKCLNGNSHVLPARMTPLLILCHTDSETSGFSELMDDGSSFSEPSPMHWPSIKSGQYNPTGLSGLGVNHQRHYLDENLDNLEAVDMELEIMKERFSKLLLGEDMSGSGKGVCTAMTILNAITNLYATVFRQNPMLEPLKQEKKALRDKTKVAETLDSFQDTKFWYAEHGSMSGNSFLAGSFRRVVVQRKDEKWGLPVPCVNPGGLAEKTRKYLQQKRDRINQIHKAAMAINIPILDEMDMPDSYLASLPKSGRAKVGDVIYGYMNSGDKFSAEHLLDSLGVMSQHEALHLADGVESAMYIWRRRRKACMTNLKSSWTIVKGYMSETGRTDKNCTLAG